MNTVNSTPRHVPIDDHETRRRAAVAVGKAYIGHPLWWLAAGAFTGLAGLMIKSARWASIEAWLPSAAVEPLAANPKDQA